MMDKPHSTVSSSNVLLRDVQCTVQYLCSCQDDQQAAAASSVEPNEHMFYCSVLNSSVEPNKAKPKQVNSFLDAPCNFWRSQFFKLWCGQDVNFVMDSLEEELTSPIPVLYLIQAKKLLIDIVLIEIGGWQVEIWRVKS